MYAIPPFLQIMIDQGYAWVDSDGCVRVHEWCAPAASKIVINNSNVNIQNLYEQ